jgi:hypothetical protein
MFHGKSIDEASERLVRSLQQRFVKTLSRLRQDLNTHFKRELHKGIRFLKYDPRLGGWQFIGLSPIPA